MVVVVEGGDAVSCHAEDELAGYPSREDLSPNAASKDSRPSSCWGAVYLVILRTLTLGGLPEA